MLKCKKKVINATHKKTLCIKCNSFKKSFDLRCHFSIYNIILSVFVTPIDHKKGNKINSPYQVLYERQFCKAGFTRFN